MNAAEAIRRMRADLQELERKQLVRPSLIQAKRSWVDAVELQLAEQQAELERMQQQVQELRQQLEQEQLRTGMLANVLSMAGLNPMMHLRKPLGNNPDIYYHAARFVDAIRSRAGLNNRLPNWSLAQIKDIIAHAIWTARLHRATDPHTPIETLADGHYHEESRAA